QFCKECRQGRQSEGNVIRIATAGSAASYVEYITLSHFLARVLQGKNDDPIRTRKRRSGASKKERTNERKPTSSPGGKPVEENGCVGWLPSTRSRHHAIFPCLPTMEIRFSLPPPSPQATQAAFPRPPVPPGGLLFLREVG